MTGVATYSNYQLISTRGIGRGWSRGRRRASGFVDPMLSPGVMVALRSAEMVTACLRAVAEHARGSDPATSPTALEPYARS